MKKILEFFLNNNKNSNVRYINDLEDFLTNKNKNTLEIIDLKDKEMSIKKILIIYLFHLQLVIQYIIPIINLAMMNLAIISLKIINLN